VDYLHANPVTRGLVQYEDDWIWSSAADWAGLRNGPISLDKESFPMT